MNLVAVAQKADMAAGPAQARMLLLVDRRLSVAKAGQISIDDRATVDHHSNPRAVGRHFLLVPFPRRPQAPLLCRHHTIDRAMHLPGLDRGIFFMGVVEDLQFHAGVGPVPLPAGHANAQTIVGSGSQPKFKPQHEVAIFLRGDQLAAGPRLTAQFAIGDLVAIDRPLPAGK